MSTSNKVSDFEAILQRFLFSPEAERFFNSGPSYQEADGPSFAELRLTYARLRDLYRPLISSTLLKELPWLAVNNLLSAAQNAHNSFAPLQSNPADINAFRNFASQLDSFSYQTQVAGLQYLASGGAALESTRSALASDQTAVQEALATLQANNADVEQLKKQVHNLVTPAVAGSLSRSFIERRNSLAIARYVWLGTLLLFAVGTVVALTYLGTGIAMALTTIKTGSSLWSVIALRSLFLIPVLAILGFAITQYRKERNFEEEYAHKAAVAVTLPSYGDLVPAGPVRDQIMTAAANQVFSSPISRTAEPESSADVINATKQVIESAAKLMPWKK